MSAEILMGVCMCRSDVQAEYDEQGDDIDGKL